MDDIKQFIEEHIPKMDSPEKVYELFKIPLCKLHIQKVEKKAYLCGLQPIRKDELSPRDLKTISREISLISEQGEHLGA